MKVSTASEPWRVFPEIESIIIIGSVIPVIPSCRSQIYDGSRHMGCTPHITDLLQQLLIKEYYR